ncbi:MAG: TolC family protein [Myxococcales bacterium]|nr:TolC family protein [Myxococcales bacterium]
MRWLAAFLVMMTIFIPAVLRAQSTNESAAPSIAANSPPAPPVDELVARALEKSPTIAAQRAKIAAAREQVKPAGALADPMLEFSGQENFMPDPDFAKGTLEFSQELPFPGKLKSRRETASAEADQQAVELKKAERQLAFDVRATYAKIYALDQEKRYLEVAKDLLKLIADTASARYVAGQEDQEALLKTQLAVSQVTARQHNLAADRKSRVTELNRLLNQSSDEPLGEVAALPAVQTPSFGGENAVRQTPDMASQKAAVAAADRRLDSAQKEVYPDFLVGLGGVLEKNYLDNSQMPMAMLKFGITLPIWQTSKQRPLLRAAEHEREMAADRQRETAAALRADFSRLESEWRRNENLIVLYQQAILPQTEAALAAARSSYLTGRGDFLTVITDFNLWLESRIELARREAERYATWAELDALRPLDAQSQGETP